VAAQLALSLDNLEALFGEVGISLANLVRLNVYTTDVDLLFQHYGALAARLGAAGVAPTTTMLGVTRLAIPGQLVELEGTAVAWCDLAISAARAGRTGTSSRHVGDAGDRNRGAGYVPRAAELERLFFSVVVDQSAYPGAGVGLPCRDRLAERGHGRIWRPAGARSTVGDEPTGYSNRCRFAVLQAILLSSSARSPSATQMDWGS
jgi:hypothetical protein